VEWRGRTKPVDDVAAQLASGAEDGRGVLAEGGTADRAKLSDGTPRYDIRSKMGRRTGRPGCG